ncbi:MAG TPA: peptidoglycan recognition family protein [Bryobacteraceae bacterium]|nr:peptidoglycan recognition family protein [Bryobacteraceae bacterium]
MTLERGRIALGEVLAAGIPDPVLRLRFLRKAGPSFLYGPRLAGRIWAGFSLLLLLIPIYPVARYIRTRPPVRAAEIQPAPPPTLPVSLPGHDNTPNIWLVEKSGTSEIWSNGLRIDNRFLAHTHARAWVAFPAPDPAKPESRTAPIGIVFHATESEQAPFEPSENGKLQRLGESLLAFVSRERAYNFVVDRFGRAWRIVPEEEAANHAGFSAWADENWRYLNLNESFLAISIESGANAEISPAQVRSAAMLVEMLRRRYNIPAANCVTHAQISVNPRNMRIGYHTDWLSGFPFAALGLPDNYAEPLPAIWAFGFDYDPSFADHADPGLRSAITAAEASLTPPLRKTLRERYRQMLDEVTRREAH